jgi:hypothetical protein
MGVIMKFLKPENHSWLNNEASENIVEIEPMTLRSIAEKICKNDRCRYPLLALRLLIHVITGIDGSGKIYISARQLSKSLDVHYDTVTKCLKFLREIEVLRIER